MSIVRSSSRRLGAFLSIAACGALVGVVVPQQASAQTRAALVRDTDAADLAPVTFSGTFPVSTANRNTLTTVPVGKRLVIDQVSYSYTALRSTEQLNAALLYTTTAQGNGQVRLYFPINPPHTLDPGAGSTVQDASFPGRAYFEAGESVYLAAGNTTFDASRAISVVVTGHYVTP